MLPYIGSGPYCYTNSLLMVLDDPALTPGLVETLTGSAFGFQLLFGGLPLFDAYGWDPDLGLDQALTLLGYTWQAHTFQNEKDALNALKEQVSASSPVFVGPLDMGLLKHQPESDRASGADHFVAVLDVKGGRVHLHDPQGHPWAALPEEVFLEAWKAEQIGYGQPYAMRTDFRRVREVKVPDALRALLPEAAKWAAGRDLPVPPGTLGGRAGLERLAQMVEQDFNDGLRGMFIHFSIRGGARRKTYAAAALALIGETETAKVLQTQARVLGSLQYPAVQRDTSTLAAGLRELAELYDELVGQLERSTTHSL